MRLGQAEAADQLAARHRRQPLLALFLAAIGVDRVHAQRALHRDEAAQAGIAALQLLADQAVADRTEVATAVLRRQGRAEQAQRGDLRHQFIGEAGLVEGIADDRQHTLVGETGDALLHRALFLVEQGTDIEQIVRMQSHGTHTQSGPGHCRSSGQSVPTKVATHQRCTATLHRSNHEVNIADLARSRAARYPDTFKQPFRPWPHARFPGTAGGPDAGPTHESCNR